MQLRRRLPWRSRVFVQLQGGLGNQLFQYAAAMAVAARRDAEVIFDLTLLEGDPARRFALGCFDIRARMVNSRERWLGRIAMGRRGVTKGVARVLRPWIPSVIKEEGGAVGRQLTDFDGDVLLCGYWQNEAYFQSAEVELRRRLVFSAEPAQETRRLMEKARTTQSIAVHVRRGDYVSNPDFNAFHGVCGTEYYAAAIAYLASRVSDPHFFVFSDDLDWAEAHLRFPASVDFVRHNLGVSDSEDLRLMSACKNFIIANSSFSWWGAWLAPHSAKLVVAPARWFAGGGHVGWNIVPSGWVKL